MNFNQIITEKLEKYFQMYALKVIDTFNNYIKLKSDSIIITISFDERENAGLLYVGKSDETMILINNDFIMPNLSNTFNKPLNMKEYFINNLALYFERDGKLILEGNDNFINKLYDTQKKESYDYTNKIIENQNLDLATKAWEKQDYLTFIQYIDKIDKKKLPLSMIKKYEISKRKTKLL